MLRHLSRRDLIVVRGWQVLDTKLLKVYQVDKRGGVDKEIE